MFIQTEKTPNPASIKFIPDKPVLKKGTAQFMSREEASVSPLASFIFEVSGVTAVYLSEDFISVTIGSDTWDDLKPQVLGAIMQFYASGKSALEEGGSDVRSEHAAGSDDPVVEQIKAVLDEKVRPAVAQDGGDVVFESFDSGVVTLRMRGACSGCPSSTMTLKHGIENLLRYYVPEVSSVEAAEVE